MRSFPRQFWLLAAGFVVLLSGIDMCFPFETTYLREEMGVSVTLIGLLLGLPIFATLPVQIVGGALTDQLGRKPVIAIGVIVIASLYLTFALATSVWQIGFAVIAEAGFGWAFFLTGSNAMIADLVRWERRAEAYSITRVTLGVGTLIGPLLAGLVLGQTGSYRALFLIGAGLVLAHLVFALVFFTETRPAVASEATVRSTMTGYGSVLRDRRFLLFCAISLLLLYGFGQIWSIFPLALRAEHGISADEWSLLLAFYAGCCALLQYPVVRLLRRRDNFMLMAAATLLVDGGLAAAVLLPGGWATLVAVFALSQGVVLFVPISSTIAAELAPAAMRGRYMGAWTLVQMGGYALGPTLGGLAADRLGYQAAFALCGALGVAGAILFASLARVLAAHPRPVQPGAAAVQPAAAAVQPAAAAVQPAAAAVQPAATTEQPPGSAGDRVAEPAAGERQRG